MLVPLLSFPAWYRRVAGALVSPFGSPADLAPLFRPETRLTLGVAYGLVVLGHLTVGFVRTGRLRAWAADAGETVLLAAHFLLVLPVLAVGVSFCVWHGYRHVARLAVIEPDSRTALREGRLWPALARFGREATPLTLASLALLAGVYLLVPATPADPLGWIGRYLVVVAVLTLPHVVVSVVDYEQAVWS